MATLVKIAREKGDKVHYAAYVDPRGHVLTWADDEAKCVPVGEEQAEKVAKFYDGRVNGGVIHFVNAETGQPWRRPVHGKEPVKVDPKGLTPAESKPDAGAAEYRRQAVILGDQLEALRIEHAAAETALANEKADNDRLRAKVAELEAIIASAK
jgi:hypothetical protein